jgi:beta-lactamase regulating signal transducer with metallopeptidase domain
MTPIADAVTAALLHSLWQGAMIALVVLAALLRPRRPAQFRYVVAVAGLAALVLLTIVTGTLTYQSDASTPDTSVSGNALPWVTVTEPLIGAEPLATGTLLGWVLPLWALGAASFSLRLRLGYVRVSRLRRQSPDAAPSTLEGARVLARRMGIERPFRVADGAIGGGPGVVGWLRPVVFLPSATLLGLTTTQLEAVLAHELAHIRRHDYLVNLIQMVVETLMFFNPAAWWLSARIRHERELCCDDLAIDVSGDALAYARALTSLERLRLMPQPGMSGGRSLAWRIRRIVGDPEPGRASASLLTVLVALSVALAGGLMPIGSRGGSIAAAAAPLPPPPASLAALSPREAAPAPPQSEDAEDNDTWALYRFSDNASITLRSPGDDGLPSSAELGGGDVLWFRLEGEAWIVRDPQVLDEVSRYGVVGLPGGPAAAGVENEEAMRSAAESRIGAAEASLANALANVDAAEADVAGARVDLELAELSSDRARALFDDGLVARTEVERAAIEVRSAQVRVESKEASLQQTETQVLARRAALDQAYAAVTGAAEALARARAGQPDTGGLEAVFRRAIEEGLAVPSP